MLNVITRELMICLTISILLIIWFCHRFAFHSCLSLVIWIMLSAQIVCYMMSPEWGIWFLVFGILGGMAWIQDWQTRYFSVWWLTVLPVFFLFACLEPVSASSRTGTIVFGLSGLLFYRRHSLGSADVICLFVMGAVLGFERMCICMLIACITGISSLAFYKGSVPFVSFLSLSFLIALARGYTLFSALEHLVESFVC